MLPALMVLVFALLLAVVVISLYKLSASSQPAQVARPALKTWELGSVQPKLTVTADSLCIKFFGGTSISYPLQEVQGVAYEQGTGVVSKLLVRCSGGTQRAMEVPKCSEREEVIPGIIQEINAYLSQHPRLAS